MAQEAEIVHRSVELNDCPKCEAKAGEPCKDSHGRKITHGERLHAFQSPDVIPKKSYYQPRYE